jgi:hypothetical protein
MLVGLVIVITAVAYQDPMPPAPRDTAAPAPVHTPAPVAVPPPPQAPPPPPPPPPTIEQVRYMDGLKTVSRGIAQIKNGLERAVRLQQSTDSVARLRAARRLGGLCGSGRSFILSGRPKMQATAYSDSLRILARQLTTRLDSLASALPDCERSAARDPTVVTTLSARLKNFDDALLAFRTAQAAVTKPDSTRTVSQQ